MTTRFHPLDKGYIVTSPYGWRAFDNSVHTGIDFGWDGGSADKPVYAIQGGTVLHAGAAQGYGGPDPAGWLVIDSSDAEGSGVFEYGHIVRLPNIRVGTKVAAGEQIGTVNGNRSTNGGVSPHLHVSRMPYEYNPSKKYDWRLLLEGAKYRDDTPQESPTGGTVSDAKDVRTQLRGPSDNGWEGLAPQPDENGTRWSAFLNRAVKAQTLVEAVGTLVFEATLRLEARGRSYADYKKRKGDTVAGNAASAAAISAEIYELLVDKLGEKGQPKK